MKARQGLPSGQPRTVETIRLGPDVRYASENVRARIFCGQNFEIDRMRLNRMYNEEFIRLPIHPGSPWSPSVLVRVLRYLPLSCLPQKFKDSFVRLGTKGAVHTNSVVLINVYDKRIHAH